MWKNSPNKMTDAYTSVKNPSWAALACLVVAILIRETQNVGTGPEYALLIEMRTGAGFAMLALVILGLVFFGDYLIQTTGGDQDD